MNTLSLFDKSKLQEEINQYCQNLRQFLFQNDLEELVLNCSIDHFAIKLANSDHYSKYIDSLKKDSSSISDTEMHNRRLATALLNQPLMFMLIKQQTSCNVMEIIEPKPEKANKRLVGFEHIEIYHKDLDRVKQFLKSKNVAFEDYENPHHRAAVLVINDKGQEIKFTDSRLEEIVEQQIAAGSSTVIV
jgi:predicted metalloenzyme YecM